MYEDDETKLAELIAEYERLQKLLRKLDEQATTVDGERAEIKRDLPDVCHNAEHSPRP